MRLSFKTEQSWGDLTQWHTAPDLNLDLGDGRDSVLSALSWTLQDGSKASVSFQSDFSTFLGYYQKPNEGPISYRGRKQ